MSRNSLKSWIGSFSLFALASGCLCPSSSFAFSKKKPTPEPSVLPSLVPSPVPSEEATDLQKLTIQQLTTIFENGTTQFQYSYIEDIGDGSGITCGMAGFTGGELLLLVNAYIQAKGTSDIPLAAYVPCLQKMGDAIEQDYSCLYPDVSAATMATQGFKVQGGGIAQYDFGKAWTDAGNDPVMQQVQQTYVDNTYYDPAMQAADQYQIYSPLGRAMIYDENIQMDSLQQIATYAQTSFAKDHDGRVFPLTNDEELEWLSYFQTERAAILNETPIGAGTVPRVDSLNQILFSGNLNLDLPFHITYFNQPFTLDGANSKDQ